MNIDKKDLMLYAVTDSHWLDGRSLAEQVQEAIAGGVTCVQLREKNVTDEERERIALEVQKVCKDHKIPFLIDDDVDLVRKIDADGVHVGQSDMEAENVRKILGPHKIIGVTAKTVEQAKKAEAMGADYLGVGAAFPTGTKKDTYVIEHKVYKAISEAVKIPIIAIGGITQENVTELNGSGIAGVAVVSAIFAADDIADAASRLKATVSEMVDLNNMLYNKGE